MKNKKKMFLYGLLVVGSGLTSFLLRGHFSPHVPDIYNEYRAFLQNESDQWDSESKESIETKIISFNSKTANLLIRWAHLSGTDAPVPLTIETTDQEEFISKLKTLTPALLRFIDDQVVDVAFYHSFSELFGETISIGERGSPRSRAIITINASPKFDRLRFLFRGTKIQFNESWRPEPQELPFPFDGRSGAMLEVFLHELGHVFAHRYNIVPDNLSLRLGKDDLKNYEFGTDLWDCFLGFKQCDQFFGYLDENSKVADRDLFDNVMRDLEKTPLVSFYAGKNVNEEFADLFKDFVIEEVMQVRTAFTVRKDEELIRSVDRFRSPGVQGQVAKMRKYYRRYLSEYPKELLE